jgi:threonine dehydrogenase-like Zn-dependent dehydrogenase
MSVEALTDRPTNDPSVNGVMKGLVTAVRAGERGRANQSRRFVSGATPSFASPDRRFAALTTPLLLRLIKAGKLRPAGLVTHRFGLDDIMQAYDTFADAAKTSALKVVLKGRGPD